MEAGRSSDFIRNNGSFKGGSLISKSTLFLDQGIFGTGSCWDYAGCLDFCFPQRGMDIKILSGFLAAMHAREREIESVVSRDDI